MVDKIDIHSLNLEELNGVISIYPWYAGARMELCNRMASMGALTETLASEAALYVGSRRLLTNLLRKGKQDDFSDNYRPEPSSSDSNKVFIAGGDFFSQSQYDSVKRADDNIFSKFATQARENGYKEDLSEDEDTDGLYTETLARIYDEQGYPDKALEIYSKLSLRYPEKSVYFAALIDEINKNKQL